MVKLHGTQVLATADVCLSPKGEAVDRSSSRPSRIKHIEDVADTLPPLLEMLGAGLHSLDHICGIASKS